MGLGLYFAKRLLDVPFFINDVGDPKNAIKLACCFVAAVFRQRCVSARVQVLGCVSERVCAL